MTEPTRHARAPAAGIPAVIPRWALAAGYVVRALFGVTTIVAASPSLLIVAGNAGAASLGVVLTAASIAALIGCASVRPAFRHLEMWGGLVLVACLIGYAAAPWQLLIAGDIQRLQLAALAVIAAVSPAGRAWHLIRTAGHHG